MELMLYLLSSLCSTVISELADKTFYITTYLSMRYPAPLVFVGTYLAKIVATTLSCAIGYLISLVLNQAILDYLVIGLFFYLGFNTISTQGSQRNDGDISDEEEEAKEVIKKYDKIEKYRGTNSFRVIEVSFLLILRGEIGHRSQFFALGLATDDFYFVFAGALIGHLFCTIASLTIGTNMISWLDYEKQGMEKTYKLLGAWLFILFGIIKLQAWILGAILFIILGILQVLPSP